MKAFLFVLVSVSVIFLSGCADDLTPVEQDRGPAPYAPDPMTHIPDTRMGSGMPPI